MASVARKAFVGGLCLVLVACGPDANPIGARILAASAGVVTSFTTRDANFLDPARIDLSLAPGTDTQHVDALWCNVVVPAVGDTDIEVGIYDVRGQQMAVPDC